METRCTYAFLLLFLVHNLLQMFALLLRKNLDILTLLYFDFSSTLLRRQHQSIGFIVAGGVAVTDHILHIYFDLFKSV